MEKLLRYLNSLSPTGRTGLCERIGTTEGYLRKAISTKQRLGESLCIRIEAESFDAVTVADLRPDLAKTLEDANYTRRSLITREAA